MSLSFWLVVLTAVTLVFRWLWRVADKIEREEAEERQWAEYLGNLWQTDPQSAWYWQQYRENMKR
jgi:hypothetical protein